LQYGALVLGEEAFGSVVHDIDVEKVEDSPIQIWVLHIIGGHHDVWVVALINLVLVFLHVVCCVCQLECLVSIKQIGHNFDVASIIIGEVLVGGDVRIWN